MISTVLPRITTNQTLFKEHRVAAGNYTQFIKVQGDSSLASKTVQSLAMVVRGRKPECCLQSAMASYAHRVSMNQTYTSLIYLVTNFIIMLPCSMTCT